MPITIHQRLTPTNFSPGRSGHTVRAICLHITDGETAAGAIGWFHNPVSKVSAHYVVDRDGTIYQTVKEEDTAWANGIMERPNLTNPIIQGWVREGVNPNLETVSIEAVGLHQWGWTVSQVGVVLLLERDIAARWGVPIGLHTVIGHREINSVRRPNCPSLTEQQWVVMRTPQVLTDDQKLEAVWRSNPEKWGEQRYSAMLTRDWYTGKVLRCANALLTPDGRDLAATNAGNILDDWEQHPLDIGLEKL